MEWINIIVSAVCALLGALGGGSVFYFQQNKRLKAAEAQRAEVIAHNEAENSEVERWKGISDRAEEQLKEARLHIQTKNEQVDRLYKRQHELENDVRVLTNKYNSAMQVIDRVRHYYCTNRPCPIGKSIPPEPVTVEQLEQDMLKAGLILPVSTTDNQDDDPQ
jgi:hypothetical protein